MYIIDGKLVSEDLKDTFFACDLGACKGACCVAGDAGAPLEPEEADKLQEIWPVVKKYLSEKSKRAIRIEGKYTQAPDGVLETPLVEGKECAYTVFENGMALCGIEKAWRDGKIDFRKPISCHLYPIRIAELHAGDALNYHKWEICKAACKKGENGKIPLYKFLREPLIRKYGEAFYAELEAVFEAAENG